MSARRKKGTRNGPLRVPENPIDKVAREAVAAFRKALPGNTGGDEWNEAEFAVASSAVRDYTKKLSPQRMALEFVDAEFFKYVEPRDAVQILRTVVCGMRRCA